MKEKTDHRPFVLSLTLIVCYLVLMREDDVENARMAGVCMASAFALLLYSHFRNYAWQDFVTGRMPLGKLIIQLIIFIVLLALGMNSPS